MRTFAFVAAAVVALSLTACGKEETASTAPETTVAPAALVEEAAPAAEVSAVEAAPAAEEQVATPEGSAAAE